MLILLPQKNDGGAMVTTYQNSSFFYMPDIISAPKPTASKNWRRKWLNANIPL